MAELSEKQLPAHIEYQRLILTQRVLLEKQDDPSESLHALIQSVYHARKELGLTFPPNFRIKFPSEKKLDEQLERRDEETLAELARKAQVVYKTVSERIKQVNEATGNDPEKLAKTDLEKNVELLSGALHFNDTQKQLLMFYACESKGRFSSILSAAMNDKVLSHEDYIDGLAIVLDAKGHKKDLKKELEPDSVLVGVNFLAHKAEHHTYSIDMPLQQILLRQYESKDDLLRGLLGPNPKTELTPKDYSYMRDDYRAMGGTLKGYLEDTSPDSHKNMLIGGPPGTGKTEITAVLAKAIGVPAFLVGVARKSERTGFTLDEPSREDRIRALVRSAFIVRQTGMKALLVFDEAEDILRDLNRDATKETGSKAFINELLEKLGAPVIFISNRTDLFDPATTRRILPFYTMNYMPFEARVGAIVDKTKQYIGTEFTADDVKELSTLVSDLSVAVIDSCINIVARRKPAKDNKALVLKAIEGEFRRALKAQHHGIPPVPVDPPFNRTGFVPELISANENIGALHTAFGAGSGNFAGADIAIVGDKGTGRRSTAQYLAAAKGMEPRVIPMDIDALAKFPGAAHALDLERSALDKQPIVFDGATPFLMRSDGHPFLKRVRAHPLPTFFVGDMPDDKSLADVQEGLSHLTFAMRTGNLSQKQLRIACEKLLGIDVTLDELHGKKARIGDIVTIKRQADALGREGDKEFALARMDALPKRMEERDTGRLGFRAMLHSDDGDQPQRVRG
jgi:hypothetical protein